MDGDYLPIITLELLFVVRFTYCSSALDNDDLISDEGVWGTAFFITYGDCSLYLNATGENI